MSKERVQKKITIIIPTKNRHLFLLRLLSYYKSLDFKGYLAIADSSNGKHLKKNIKMMKEFESYLNILYLECPDMGYNKAIINILPLVKTEYVAQLNDDDFLIPSGLSQFIQFLNNNQNYSAVHGLGVSIKTLNSDQFGNIIKCVKKTQPSTDSNTASERFMDIMGNYSDVNYSLQRIKDYKRIYNFQGRDNHFLDDNNFSCTLSSAIIPVLGKVKEIDVLYLVRHIQDKPYRTEYQLNPCSWLSHNDWQSNYLKFKDFIKELLMEVDGISNEVSNENFDKGFIVYLSIWLSQFASREPMTRKSMFGFYNSNLFSYWPRIKNDRIIKTFRVSYTRIRVFTEKFINKILRREALESDILSRYTKILLPSLLNKKSKHHEDFMPVYNSITNPPENL